MHGHAARILFDTDAFAVGNHDISAEPFLYRLVEDHVQAAAMDTDFRKGISGEFSAVLAINQLPETVEEGAVALSIPALSNVSPKPRALNSRMACRSSVMPTPSSLICVHRPGRQCRVLSD